MLRNQYFNMLEGRDEMKSHSMQGPARSPLLINAVACSALLVAVQPRHCASATLPTSLVCPLLVWSHHFAV